MAAVDGLVTGLDTATIVKQLMDIERLPQNKLKSEQAFTTRIAGAYRALNTQFLAVKTAAETITTGTVWGSAKTTSSDTARVTASAASGAAAGSLTFTVDRLATAGVSASSGTVTSADSHAVVTTPADVVRLTKGTTSTDVKTGDGKLSTLVKNINDAKAGVTATAVQVSPGQWKLHLASTTTGAASAIRLDDGTDGGNPFTTASLGSVAAVGAPAQDAKLTVGGATGYEVVRPSNKIDDLLPGVTLNLVKADAAASVTIDTVADTAAVADTFGKLIDTVNKALDEMKKYTAVNPETKTGSLLTGDAMVRSLQRSLIDAVGGGHARMGVSVTREGTISFDKAKFTAAYEADPKAVRDRLAGKPLELGPPVVAAVPGVAERILTAAHNASRKETDEKGPGRITSAIKGRDDAARGYDSQIANWDSRLALRETALKKKFAGLEVALGKMQQQGSWLAGQLAGLPTGGNA